MNGLIDAEWARVAVASVESALAAIRAMYRLNRIDVVWGEQDPQLAEMAAGLSPEFLPQVGLLRMHNHNVEIEVAIYRHGDPDFPNPMYLRISFGAHQPFPLEARCAYNLLAGCEPGVSLELMPSTEGHGIDVTGVGTVVPTEGLSGRTLHDAFSRLTISHNSAHSRLADGEGGDLWGMARA